MNQDRGRAVIFLYNLYALFLGPLTVFMCDFWTLECRDPNSYGRGGGMPGAVILVFLPELVLGLSWGLSNSFGEKLFTILGSVVVGWLLNRLFHLFFMIRTYAPITYYVMNAIIVSGIIWTIVIEFNQNLREHLLLYSRDKVLVPNAEDEAENQCWHGIWKALVGVTVILTFLVVFRII